jgi:enamine deaminase RidA (YjgF/YER057c/UK114 family)
MLAYSTFATPDGHRFAALPGRRPVLVITAGAGAPFERLMVSVPDPEASAALSIRASCPGRVFSGWTMTDTAGMAAEFVSSARLFAGAPYAYAATSHETGLVLTAGACPLDDQGRVVSPGDIALQMRRAIDNLRIALEECGAQMGDVLKTTIFVSSNSRDDLLLAWNEVAAAFGDTKPPSTLLGVAVLGYPDQLVEIEAIALAAPR